MTRTQLIRSFLICIGISMLLGVVALLIPSEYVPGELLGTVALFVAFSVLTLIHLTLGSVVTNLQGSRSIITLVGVTTSILSFIGYVSLIWFNYFLDLSWVITDRANDFTSSSLLISMWCVHLLLIRSFGPYGRGHDFISLLVGEDTKAKWIRFTAVTTLTIVIAWFVFILLYPNELDFIYDYDEIIYRFLAACGIVSSGCTLIAGVLRLFLGIQKQFDDCVLNDHHPLSLECPRCQSHVDLKANTLSYCNACRLRIKVDIEEPRCLCGYLLYKLDADDCPECGRSIDPELRWRSSDTTSTTSAVVDSDDQSS